MGRPKLKIDPDQVRNLAKQKWSVESMARHFKCHRDTLTDRFSKEIAEGRQEYQDLLWSHGLKRAFKENSDRVWIHLMEREFGKVAQVITEEPKFKDKAEAIRELRAMADRLQKELEEETK